MNNELCSLEISKEPFLLLLKEILKGMDGADKIILLLVLFFILIALVFVVGLSLLYPNTTITDNNTTNNAIGNDLTPFICPTNDCAINLQTGRKRCPPANQSISYDPSTEGCSAATSCTNSLLPYAVNNDGSVNADGICSSGMICNCQKTPQCPEYLLTGFRTQNGNSYISLTGQRINFTQFSALDSNTTVKDGSIVLSNTGSQFCAIPSSWIFYATPGCPAVNGTPTLSDVLACMNLPKEGLGNPCLSGALAFLPGTVTFNSQNAISLPMGCVRGNSLLCRENEFNVWDILRGEMICKQLE